MTIGTDAKSIQSAPPSPFDANLSALRSVSPRTADLINSAIRPIGLEKRMGRDGTTTFSWIAGNGVVRWLGPTTTPIITARALLEKFDLGTGNCLLPGIGDGALSSEVLQRLRPHQALFVIEQDEWKAASAFELFDFSYVIRTKRLNLFVGTTGWQDCQTFLIANPGILPPDRTLALPWIDRDQTRSLTNQMALLHQMRDFRSQGLTAQPLKSSNPLRVFVAANSLDSSVHRLARSLEFAITDGLNGDVFCTVLDRPDCLHPQFVRETNSRLEPNHSILIDCAPNDIQHSAQNSKTNIVLSHTEQIAENWLATIPKGATLWVRTTDQQRTAIKSGFESKRVHLYSPGVNATEETNRLDTSRLYIYGLVNIPTARDVGLNLRSHQKIWQCATALIKDRVDDYVDEHAAAVLRDVERTLQIKIESDDVRGGLETRIRRFLGPACITATTLERLTASDFDVTPISNSDNVPRPPGLLIWPTISRIANFDILSHLAHGHVLLVRKHNQHDSKDGLGKVLEISKHCKSYDSLNELIKLISNPNSSELVDMANDCRQHLTNSCSWAYWMQSMLDVNEKAIV